jgi:hypothetical protein
VLVKGDAIFTYQFQTCNNPNCQCNFDAYCSSGDNGAIRGDGDNNVGLTASALACYQFASG